MEFSGEFVDFLDRDLKKYYPRLVDLVSFKIVQAGPSVRARFGLVVVDCCWGRFMGMRMCVVIDLFFFN